MTTTQINDLVRAVSFMRTYQKQYFEARRLNQVQSATELMRKAKGFEARVDSILKDITEENTNQPELFAR